MLTTGWVLGVVLTLGLASAGPVSGESRQALAPEEKNPTVACTPLLSLAGKGQLYFGTTQQAVVDQWRQRLHQLELPATITWNGCISSSTPDRHAFYLLVVPSSHVPNSRQTAIRVTLHWQDADYASVGWRLLQELDRKRRSREEK